MENNKLEITAPWGDAKIDLNEHAQTIRYVLDQLKFFQKTNNTEQIRKDIQGYEAILSSSNPNENAKNFMRTKRNVTIDNKPFESNIAIVEYLQNNGLWND